MYLEMKNFLEKYKAISLIIFNKWYLLFVPLGIFLFVAYIHNLKPALFYWWFELTNPWTWFSLRYWILGSIFDGALLATSVLPLGISFWAADDLKNKQRSISKKIAVAVGFIFLMFLSVQIAALIAGYIGPNYLKEFYFWYYQ